MGGNTKAAKKKGPKGKKARAKAKLDRQWGEQPVIDDRNQTKRIGKSRLLAKEKKRTLTWGDDTSEPSRSNGAAVSKGILRNRQLKEPVSRSRRHHEDGDNDDDDDDLISLESNESNDDEEGDALSDLLTSIQKKSTKKKKKRSLGEAEDGPAAGDNDMEETDESEIDEDEDENEEMENFSGGEEDSDIEMDDDDDDDDSVVGASNDNSTDGSGTVDLFRQRFGRQPLQQTDLESKPSSATISLNEAVQLDVTRRASSNTLDELVGTEAADSTKKLQTIAEQSFAGNRVILQRQWQRLQPQERLSDDQASIYSFLARYADLLVTLESRKQRNEMHRLYMLHILNHVLTSRSRIQRHNKKIKELEDKDKEGEEEDSKLEEEIDEEQFRDQGFTRPSVLVLLPTRATAHKFVHQAIKMLKTEVPQPFMERFETDYGRVVDEEDAPLGEEQERRRKAVLKKKGKEWNELFGDEVNQDDDFKLGIQLIPKTAKGKKDKKSSSNIAMKLYSDFYKSDIIVASPLGLKMLIQKSEGDEDGDHDYLSSIEVCLMEYADVMMMQNWDHVNYILGLLNKQPEKNNSTDFSRVRNYFLEGQAANWRQLIMSTSIVDPFMLNSFKRFGKSESGSIKVRRQVLPENAAIGNVLVPMKQVFQKVSSPSPKKQGDSRVDFFANQVLPQILQSKQKHTMIYIPSYFDFVTLRNIMLKRELSFVSVTEYSRPTEVNRGRARFLQGRKPIMLFTGRCNFFHRHAIKGIKHLILLGLPEHPEFYSDQVNLINTSAEDVESDGPVPSCLVLFTRYEAHALERIVGTGNCGHMLRSDKNTFMFHS